MMGMKKRTTESNYCIGVGGGVCEQRGEWGTDRRGRIIKSRVDLFKPFAALHWPQTLFCPLKPLLVSRWSPFLSSILLFLSLPTCAAAPNLFLELPHPPGCTGESLAARLPDLLIPSLVIASSLHICATAAVCRRVWLPRVCARCITDSINIISSVCSLSSPALGDISRQTKHEQNCPSHTPLCLSQPD